MLPNLPETDNEFTNITFALFMPTSALLLLFSCLSCHNQKSGGGDLKAIATEETPLLRSTCWNSLLHFDFIYSVTLCITPRDARRVLYH